MRKHLMPLGTVAVLLSSPLLAQSGPKMGKDGGIGSSTSTYSGGEPTGGTYSINGTNGSASFKGQMVNVRTNGTAGDGATDDGVKIANSIAAAGTAGVTVFPHTANGYMLNSGGFPLGTYPSQTWSWPNNTSVYPSPAWYSLGANRFQGPAIGDPNNCTGFLFSPYTQTCLAITDYKVIMDPASVWQGDNTTNVGMSLGCLPNHRSPNTSNVTGAGLRRNWIACLYVEGDTGQDGQPNAGGSGFGSSISTELYNNALNIGSNSGIMHEDNLNIYASPTDGGITRAYFILSSCGPFNSGTFSGRTSCQASVKSGKSPWGVTSETGSAIDINATPFTSTTAPSTQTNGFGETVYSGSSGNYTVYPRWTNGVSSSGAVYNFVARGVVTGESGYYYEAVNAAGTNVFNVDKIAGNIRTTGSVTAGAYVNATGSMQITGPEGDFRYLTLATAGSSRWEIGVEATAESGSNVGSDFYISRRADNGSSIAYALYIKRSTGMVTMGNIMQLAGFTVSALPTCNSTTKGSMAHATDVTAVTYNTAPTGGGSLDTPVYCDGTGWKMH